VAPSTSGLKQPMMASCASTEPRCVSRSMTVAFHHAWNRAQHVCAHKLLHIKHKRACFHSRFLCAKAPCDMLRFDRAEVSHKAMRLCCAVRAWSCAVRAFVVSFTPCVLLCYCSLFTERDYYSLFTEREKQTQQEIQKTLEQNNCETA